MQNRLSVIQIGDQGQHVGRAAAPCLQACHPIRLLLSLG